MVYMESKAEARRQKKMEYNKQYRIDHADTIRGKAKEGILCDCGLLIHKKHRFNIGEDPNMQRNFKNYNNF